MFVDDLLECAQSCDQTREHAENLLGPVFDRECIRRPGPRDPTRPIPSDVGQLGPCSTRSALW
jgi:hypothetical protein